MLRPCFAVLQRSFRDGLFPIKKLDQTCRGQLNAFSVRAHHVAARRSVVATFHPSHAFLRIHGDEQPCSKNQFQTRQLHTSQTLRARSSFARRVKDKIQKFRQDPNAQQKLMGVGAAGYTVTKVAKFGVVAKYALPALKLTKAMPLMSMGLTTICYTCFFGFPFAIGIVGTLFSSNLGRALLLRKYGCEVQPVMMIPFFGTMNTGSANSDYTKTESFVLADKPFKRCMVTLAPVAGMFLFTAVGPFGTAGMLFNSQCGYAVANTGFMMGMFSLLPLGEMTPGGQLLDFFSKNALIYGTVFNLALITVLPNPILYLCFFLNLWRIYQRGFTLFGRQFGGSDDAAFNDVARGLATHFFSDNQKIVVASMYWSLFLLNAGGMMLVGKYLATPQQLRRQHMVEERERRLAEEPYALPQHHHGDFSNPPAADMGGWGIGDWALGNLEVVEDMDRESDDWWGQGQAPTTPANETWDD